MSRPTLEVADIIRRSGSNFSENGKIASGLAAPQGHGCYRSLPALRLSEVIAISVCAAAIRLSPITRAATGTVPSARATHAPSGWPSVPPSCFPCPTSISSSRCRTSYPRWSFRTSGCSTTCFSAPVPRRCLKWLATRSTWAPTSDCSVCCTLGDRTCSIIRMSTA